MKIVARMLSAKEIWVEGFPVDRVNEVKRLIEQYEGYPAGWQRLYYNGTELDGGQVLHSYDIRYMVNRLDLVVVVPPPCPCCEQPPPCSCIDEHLVAEDTSEYTSGSE